jgi:catechol 2,3-dioxygenase-like lactoylglutathione lyase family enzyme
MAMTISAEHLGLAARNPTALKDWYLRVLGAELVFADGKTPPAYFVRVGALLIEIYQSASWSEATADNRLSGWRHVALRVEAIESAQRELESRGVHFDQEIKPAGGGGRILFFKDGEDNLLHLVERPKETIFG